MNIFLIGPMGAGKSTIGRIIAQELNRTYLDSDKVITERAGANIPWIFDMEGEEGFRDREEKVLAELCQQNDIILATGGGAILSAANRAQLHTGYVVYLYASVEQQLKRTAMDKNRPLLDNNNPKQVLTDLFNKREELYQELCDLRINTDQGHPRNVALEIITEYQTRLSQKA